MDDQPGSRGSNSRPAGRRPRPRYWFEYGFEAGTEEVCRLVGPDDPPSEEEWWVGDEPATDRLELRDWHCVADEHVGWDLWRNDGPCTPSEVRARLRAVGDGVRAFVAAHGGFAVEPRRPDC